MKNLAERYNLLAQGGVIFTEPNASRLLIEVGLIDKLNIGQTGLHPGKATLSGIVDATIADYYVAGMLFPGFRNPDDNGFAAFVMAKNRFTCVQVIAQLRDVAMQMDDASFAGWYPVVIETDKN